MALGCNSKALRLRKLLIKYFMIKYLRKGLYVKVNEYPQKTDICSYQFSARIVNIKNSFEIKIKPVIPKIASLREQCNLVYIATN